MRHCRCYRYGYYLSSSSARLETVSVWFVHLATGEVSYPARIEPEQALARSGYGGYDKATTTWTAGLALGLRATSSTTPLSR